MPLQLRVEALCGLLGQEVLVRISPGTVLTVSSGFNMMQGVLTPSVLFLIGSAGIRDIEYVRTLPLRMFDHDKINTKIRVSPMSLSG